ncbi:MAG: relaxase/mobilization nuclease domain-containing protein [Thermoguttaceae bacterium]
MTLCDIRNLAAENVPDALHEMEVVALGTFCKNFFYHVNINPLDTEQLTPQQWEYAVDTLETNLGLEGHARFVVQHRKKGRTHRHVIWSRIEVSRMRAVKMTHDYAKHQATARQLEREFGLRCVESVLGPDKVKGRRPKRRPKAWESFRGKKSGIDPIAMTAEITALYRGSVSGEEFAAALNERGYRLMKATRQDLCVMDAVGHIHSLAKRLDGIRTNELWKSMKHIAV